MKAPLDSLRLRLLVILVGSLAAMQLFSYGAVGVSRGFAARHLANEQTAQDVRWLHARLQPLTPAERASQLPDLRRGTYRLALWPADAPLAAPTGGDLVALGQTVQKRVGPAVAVTATSEQTHPALAIPLDDVQRLAIVFDQPLPNTRPSLGKVLLYAALVVVLVSLLAVWAVAAVSRPLERLTTAGRRMVADIANAPPLAERGPAEVRTLAASLNTMQRAVQAQLRERTFMLGAIAHDLKTPLTRLKLRLADLPADAPAQAMQADADAMDGLINEGLAYARSAQLREQRLPVDLVALVEALVDQSVDLGQPVALAPAEGPIVLTGAPRALTRMVQNLVDNALRYGGQADVVVRVQHDGVAIEVADRGPGIPLADQERMFEPFVRGEASRDRSLGGTGLGLAIARNIAMAHGGHAILRTREGGGLIARVTLPLRR